MDICNEYLDGFSLYVLTMSVAIQNGEMSADVVPSQLKRRWELLQKNDGEIAKQWEEDETLRKIALRYIFSELAEID